MKELISSTKAQIFCLIRAADKKGAINRLITNLKRYKLFQEIDLNRLNIVVGDLSKRHFGLNTDQWVELAVKIDTIYHCAALLNFALPYDRLRETNVLGTIEIIKLSVESKVKPLHYISTLIKVSQTCADPNQLAKKNTTLTFDTAYDEEYLAKNGFNIGYHQSKWVAEELVLEAEQRGLPVIIYRSSLISGDSISYAWNTNDYICQLTKGLIQLGKAPDQDMFFDFCPVDYLARSVVYLSLQPESIGMGYVLKNPDPITWSDYIRYLNEFGFPIKSIKPEIWLERLAQLVREDESNPLCSLLPLFEVRPSDRLIVATPKNIRSLEIIAEKTTRSVLKKAKILFPVTEKSLIFGYLNLLKSTGFIP